MDQIPHQTPPQLPPQGARIDASAPPPNRLKRGCGIGCALLALIVIGVAGGMLFAMGQAAPYAQRLLAKDGSPPRAVRQTPVRYGQSDDKIAIINVHGVIYSGGSGRGVVGSGDLIEQLRAAQEDGVKAIVLDLNTPGGEVTATDEVHHEMQKLREDGIKIVSCMRTVAASGGYYLAAGSDHIVANRLTITGSIGVVIGGMNYADLLEKIGVTPEVYTSGALKDMLSPMRKRDPNDLEDPEVKLIRDMVAETHLEFATIVADGRPDLTLEQVKTGPIGDAAIFSGVRAKELGLVDQIGYLEDAIDKAQELAGLTDPTVMRYGRMPSNITDLLFSKNETPPTLAEMLSPHGQVIKKGQLYYLYPLSQ
ncbi:MAG: protease-4 [Rhodothermales bacterium]|jgi:protease-4